MTSNLGFWLAGAYISLSVFCVFTQGLIGESFIAIALGIPWSFLLAYFEYWQTDGLFLILLLLVPMVLNTFFLFRIGTFFSGKSSNESTTKQV